LSIIKCIVNAVNFKINNCILLCKYLKGVFMKRVFACALLFFVIILFFLCDSRSLVDKLHDCGYLNMDIQNNADCQIITIECFDNVDKLIDDLSIEVHNKKTINDRLLIEGYTHFIGDYILINDIKTNIQISVFDSKLIVGSPLICDSF